MSDATQNIDTRIAELADWRGNTLARIRTLIKQADPDVIEEASTAIPGVLPTFARAIPSTKTHRMCRSAGRRAARPSRVYTWRPDRCLGSPERTFKAVDAQSPPWTHIRWVWGAR